MKISDFKKAVGSGFLKRVLIQKCKSVSHYMWDLLKTLELDKTEKRVTNIQAW